MKRSYTVFWKRNLAFAKLAIVSNLEYRLNYFVDAVVQPTLTTGIEILLWFAVFRGAQTTEIAGFTREYYLSYALWGAFFARICTSWMYESRMIQEIDSGSINSLLTRPMSYYEYYFSQLMGYKFITTIVSMIIPLMAIGIFELPTKFARLPMAFALEFYYLILVHSISFVIASCAFYLNKVYSFTAAKNLALWLLTGELFPLDLMPEPFKSFVIALPFSAGVYVPVGYLTGRLEIASIYQSFISVTIGIVVVNLLGAWMWKKGLNVYTGTGA
ncbi:ABC transporter permease [Bdellovibrio svalbardensis]|uniref:ABC-2 family transporter protein n=1 Tax=Bdellovibrio svalbardensis TaxID=2972972 RepID=A0ABT6DFG3_9BACT|nr:ABC-2 family transporter protein [Bdellovibrio svalbardensis]MDG0815207.1 ABC-2 family transporter protein [Bdellovibrio svalbardensis]